MIETLYQSLLGAVFPSACDSCGNLAAPSQQGVCGSCLASYSVFCGAHPEPDTPRHLDALWAVGNYEGLLKRILCRLKFDRRMDMTGPILALAERRLSQMPTKDRWDRIVCVPMPADLKNDRGFNQAEVLARKLSRSLQVPYLGGCLKVDRPMRVQSTLGREARLANTSGAFLADGRKTKGHRILLVDDILTTGSTVSSCALALREAGALSVEAFIIARGALT